MTEKDNVATYARIRPYNPAINEDKRLTARVVDGNKILNQNNDRQDTYNFTRVYDMKDSTMDLFETAMKPLLDYKILQGINSIFIVYGQSGSGKSFTLIGEQGHLGVLPLSLQYLLDQPLVERVDVSTIECYGIKATKIGFYDLVVQLSEKHKNPKKYDAYTTKDNSRLNSSNAQTLQITKDNCLKIITELQEVSHMAPTLKNPHSSRGHTVYFCKVKMKELEDVFFIAIDLAGSEGATALGTKDEFVNGLELAMSKGKLKLNKKQMKGFEQMYKTRFYEAACINNGLTQLQTIFGELIKQKISKSQGLGLRKVLSSFLNLKTAYAILFTLSASANNNKTTRATLNFAKQTQLVKVDTVRAKKKIDKDAIIKELNTLITKLRSDMEQKDNTITHLKQQLNDFNVNITNEDENKDENILDDNDDNEDVLDRIAELNEQLQEAEAEEKQWTISEMDIDDISGGLKQDDMKQIFDEFDEDCGGTIDSIELQNALKKMGLEKTKEEVKELIEEVDETGSGEVNFNEFKQMASKNWFVDVFQNQIAEQMQTELVRAMSVVEHDEKNDEILFERDKEELIEEIKRRKETVINLQDKLDAKIDEINRRKETEINLQDKLDAMSQNGFNDILTKQMSIASVDMDHKYDQMENENDKLKKQMSELENKFETLRNDFDVLGNENDGLKDSKINMINQCNEQLNLLRMVVIGCSRKAKSDNSKLKLPFSIDFRWRD